MKKLTLLEVQSEAYNILKIFHDYCVDNNLRYQLAYGTCLGAIRHKGYIPWDDDVDIMMPRPDFEKLLFLVKEKPLPGLELLSFSTNKEYSSPLAKIHNPNTLAIQKYSQIDKPRFGVYIDVFVVDGVPSSTIAQRNLFRVAYRLRRFWGLSVSNWNYEKNEIIKLIKLIIAFPFKLVGYRNWVRIYNWVCKKNSFEEEEKAGVILFGEGIKKEIFDKSLFEQSLLIKFNDSLFFVPQNYEDYLRQMYGDFMKLPPKEQRVSKHGTDFYDFPAGKYQN